MMMWLQYHLKDMGWVGGEGIPHFMVFFKTKMRFKTTTRHSPLWLIGSICEDVCISILEGFTYDDLSWTSKVVSVWVVVGLYGSYTCRDIEVEAWINQILFKHSEFSHFPFDFHCTCILGDFSCDYDCCCVYVLFSIMYTHTRALP